VLPDQWVFIDGGSSDGTLAIIKEHMERHANAGGSILFEVVDQGGAHGVPDAFNIGLQHNTSEVVFILNTDDWLEPHCAEIVLDAMTKNPWADVVLANARTHRIGDNNRRNGLGAWSGSQASGAWRIRPEWLFPVLMPFVHPATFVRKRVYDTIGGFDASYLNASDYEFLYRCQVKGVRFLKLGDTLANFQLGGGANMRRAQARLEVYRAARRHSGQTVIPFCALLLRFITGR
jgi:glycosyltransferase involved in cell wall biosynthesis